MQDARKRILRLVEEGKLAVDEALTLLEGLDSQASTVKKTTLNFGKKQVAQDLDVSQNGKFEEAKKEESQQAKFQFAKDKIFDFVDTALKKIKDLDLDFNFGKSVEVSHIYQHADVSLKDINIDVANGSLRIVPWDQNDVRVECYAKVYRVDTEQEARDQFVKDVIFSIEGDKLRFITQQKWMKLDAVLYIPQTQYEKVRVRMFNGPISSEELTVNDYWAKTANGKIELAGVYGQKLEAETANGQIQIKRSKIDKLEAETINGAINLEGDFQEVELHSFNGNVSCNLTGNRCGTVVTKVTTGSIDLFIPEEYAVEGELKSNLGGLNILLEGVQITEEKSEVVQKSLRFKSVQPSEHPLKIYADTKTGSVNIKKAEAVGSGK